MLQKYKIPMILILSITMIILSGCGSKESVTEAPSVSESSLEKETISEISMPEEFRFEFNPHVISRDYALLYGENISEEFYSFCDAILHKEEAFACISRERLFQMLEISNSCFPLAQELIDKEKTTVSDGVCHLVYRYEAAQIDEIIYAFEKKVYDVIQNAIPYEEPDWIKAMELFTAVAKKDTYDSFAALEDSLKLKTYRVIMEDTGICQEITGEYIYYLLQIGIDAIPVSALNEDLSEAHEWVLVNLDGKYYHMDPTYATNYPDSLFFFGMDDIQREYYGSLPAENYVYAESDLYRDIYTVTDRRFEKFWLAESYEIDHISRKISVTETNTGEIHIYDFE